MEAINDSDQIYNLSDTELRNYIRQRMGEAAQSMINQRQVTNPQEPSYQIGMAMLGLMEYHKRQNDKANRITLFIAGLAVVISIIGIAIQVRVSQRPMQIKSSELLNIQANLAKDQNDHRLDSVLFYLKKIATPLKNHSNKKSNP